MSGSGSPGFLSRGLAAAASLSARVRSAFLERILQRWGDEAVAKVVERLPGQTLAKALSRPGDFEGALRGLKPDAVREALLRSLAAMSGEAYDPALFTAFTESSGAGVHFSQEGEDLFLLRALGDAGPGFFVDVGAHHPTRFSNTYALYLRGWRGLNIDATPGSMEAFRGLRPEDINVEAAVSDSAAPLRFHMFREPALNTFDAALAETYVKDGWPLLEVREITPRPLRDIMARHWPKGRPVHLMSIDVEGEEMGVLGTNDWETCRPDWVVIEALDVPLAGLGSSPGVRFLADFGYAPVSKLFHSVILKRES